MSKRKYTKLQGLLPEIKAMVEEGRSQREIAEYYGIPKKRTIKDLLRRERQKVKKAEAGIHLCCPGRPKKDAQPRDILAEQAYEIKRLKRENELLRDFLWHAERK